MASAAERATKRPGSPPDIGPTRAAETAAVEDVGETISWRVSPAWRTPGGRRRRGAQPGRGGQAGDLPVCHRLRDHQGPRGEAGHEVGACQRRSYPRSQPSTGHAARPVAGPTAGPAGRPFSAAGRSVSPGELVKGFQGESEARPPGASGAPQQARQSPAGRPRRRRGRWGRAGRGRSAPADRTYEEVREGGRRGPRRRRSRAFVACRWCSPGRLPRCCPRR